jgi:hypothetical protein
MTSTHEGEFDLPTLRPEARRAHIIPALHNCSLLSIGQLTDAGYIAIFDATRLRVYDSDNIYKLTDQLCVLSGTRHSPTGMWHIDAPVRLHLANRVGAPTVSDLVTFAHATLFSPSLSTLEEALLRNYLINFPGLNVNNLRRHPPTMIPMTKGHLAQTRKNQRSTKPKLPTVIPPESDDPCHLDPDAGDHFPTTSKAKTHQCFATIMEPTGQIYTDQTGRFVSPSSNGNNYLMVLYDYDSNFIFAQPFTNRTTKCILAAYQVLHTRLCVAGLKPQLQRLDNECSTILKQFMQQQDIDFQLVPPGVHRRNAAERAI